MADHAEDDFDGDDIFIYRGGWAPQHVTHVLIDQSVNEIEDQAHENCVHLVRVDTHDGLRKIGQYAFWNCSSLKRINLKSAIEIDREAFYDCDNLESVEFGDRLQTIGYMAFCDCRSLTHLKLPFIITIRGNAFDGCTALIDIELSERLETIEEFAFNDCERLQRIAIPLKRDLIVYDDNSQAYNQFDDCGQLKTVDLVGGIHETIASLHMESWRTEMNAEINRINQVLPNTPSYLKTDEIREWMDSVIDKMDHYKAEHCSYVREGITLLELAIWKAKLGEREDNCEAEGKTKNARIDTHEARKDRRITCGADIVIKNVLPFLQLE
jgi:hypothetical protein